MPRDHVVLVSAYLEYNIPTMLHVKRLNHILVKEKRTLIGADTNGHSKLWHSLSRNRRCRITEELIDRHGLQVHNLPGQMNTFCRSDGRTSNIDATLSTADIEPLVRGWQVKDLTDSDHRVITLAILLGDHEAPLTFKQRRGIIPNQLIRRCSPRRDRQHLR
ncbi:unnamed protein product [Macrosiphum euphorbiae]|uniref:Endonuclease/exonuclease/phosphatase domain-containing protein n=1 Tax=Macrosiphum euphorbiae TaxID=13131 RepID=A0AAV0WNQ0_9HEMI|nr:unnamed protein product [Macrosiphum euphorbiae]